MPYFPAFCQACGRAVLVAETDLHLALESHCLECQRPVRLSVGHRLRAEDRPAFERAATVFSNACMEPSRISLLYLAMDRFRTQPEPNQNSVWEILRDFPEVEKLWSDVPSERSELHAYLGVLTALTTTLALDVRGLPHTLPRATQSAFE